MSERLFVTISLTLSLILLTTTMPGRSSTPTLRSWLRLASIKIEQVYYRL